METMSRTSSTTQTRPPSRRSLAQYSQSSAVEMLKQRAQKRVFSFTAAIASDRRRASAASAFRMWKARRWAVFGPMPGSRVSASTRSWTGPANTGASAWPSAHAREAHAPRERPEPLRGEFLLSPEPVVERCPEQVLQHAGVVGVDRGRVDGHAADLLAGEGDLDRPAAGAALHDRLGQLGLRLCELGLHLLDLLHHLVHVHAVARFLVAGVWPALSAASPRRSLRRSPHESDRLGPSAERGRERRR